VAVDASYLKQRKQGWYVRVKVPTAAQEAFGSKTITRSLHTRDKAEASRRKHAVVVELFALIDKVAGLHAAASSEPRGLSPEDILKSALAEREAIEAGDQRPLDAERALDATVEDFLGQQAALQGTGSHGRPRIAPTAEAVIKSAYKALRGAPDLFLSRDVEVYLKEQGLRLTAQTVADKRKRLESFVLWFGGEREASEVTRKVAGEYVTQVVQNRTQKDDVGSEVPLSPTTLGKEVSDLRTFFQWLQDRGALDTNPFHGMASTIKESSRAKPSARRQWKPAELSKVLHGFEPNDPLWALTVIAAYTGMRREEVATLRVESVIKGNLLNITEGKTKAARREVPIHTTLAPLIKQLVKTSSDGYLIPGLLPGGPDKKRGWLVGKRFGYAVRQLGIEDTQLDFHALRGTVITQLEEAGIPIPTIQLIVGHERQGVTLGYSDGASEKLRRAALLNVSYGKLDTFVRETGSKVVVQSVARPRGSKLKEK